MQAMTSLMTLLLCLGILPSLMSISLSYPGPLTSGIGPPHALKLGLPLLLFWVWKNRQKIPRSTWIVLGGTLILAITCIGDAAYRCDFPRGILRETSVMIVGFLAAVTFITLPRPQQHRVLSVWAWILLGSIVLDLIWYDGTQYLLSSLFDPQARKMDVQEVGSRALSGVFGRQSLAKLLLWLPWLMANFWFRHRLSQIFLAVSLPLVAVAAMGGAQRGPMVAVGVGGFAWALHHCRLNKNFKALRLMAYGTLAAAVGIMLLVPRIIWEVRLKAMLGIYQAPSWHTDAAVNNQNLRLSLLSHYGDLISKRPWGDLCIPQRFFEDARLYTPFHSHNLFLQQYVHGGWIWGTAHLGLWLWAALRLWKRNDPQGSILFGGITAVLVSGFFDHPWFVINHAMILWMYLFYAFLPQKSEHYARA